MGLLRRASTNEADNLGAREYATRAKARDPISGGSVAVLSMVTKYHKGVAEIFYNPPKGLLNTMFAIPQGELPFCLPPITDR